MSNSELLWNKTHEVLQRIAYKVGRDEYGLSRGDFVIRYFPWKRHAYRTTKSGATVRVYFGVFPMDKEFEFYLHQALKAVKVIVQNKGHSIEKLDVMRKRMEEAKDPNWESLPKLVAREELEITEYYKVVVKHKKTQIVLTRESKRPEFARMIVSARIEMTEMLEALPLLEDEKGSAPVVEPAIVEAKEEVAP